MDRQEGGNFAEDSTSTCWGLTNANEPSTKTMKNLIWNLTNDSLCFLLQTLYKTQVKELKEEIDEKNKETQRKMQELQNEKYAHCVSQIHISFSL